MGKLIGIDLGTTNTVVSVVNKDGEAVVINTSEGISYIPSVVCYDAGADFFYIGQTARDMMMKEPENTVYSAKRLMGMHYIDKDLEPHQNVANRMTFAQIEKWVGYKLAAEKDGKDDGVRIVLGRDKYLTPEEISAKILAKAKEEAELHLGGEEVTGAVITHPAYFELRQIEATRRAGEMAGLKVKRLLEEPTAAAIAAGHNQQHKNRYVLVYDLGGGTFDVSLLKVNNNQFKVQALGGDNLLGGDNFDDEILKMVAEHVKQKENYDPISDRAFRLRLKRSVEDAKILLSTKNQADINVPYACHIPEAHGRGRGRAVVVRFRVERAEFEKRLLTYLNETNKVVDGVLNAADVPAAEIDEVLLVGGSTYVPSVRAAMEAKFPGKVRPVDGLHPMHCVAQGAAILAAEIEKAEKAERKAERTSVAIPSGGVDVGVIADRSLGIEVRSGDHRDVFKVIIPRGTPLPMKAPKEHKLEARKRDSIRVPVYAGENPRASKNKFQGNIDLPLADNPVEPKTPVTVGLRLDEQRILEVTIHIQGRDPVVKSLNYQEGIDVDDDEWKEKLQGTMTMAQDFLLGYKEYLDDRMAQQLQDDIDRSDKALSMDNRKDGRIIRTRLTRKVLYSDELGNLLFQAERLVRSPDLSQEGRDDLQMRCLVAKEYHLAHKAQATPERAADLLNSRKDLEIAISVAIRSLPSIAEDDDLLQDRSN